MFKFILSARRRVLKRFRGAPGTTKSVSASRFELFSPKTGEKRIAANLRANCARRLRAAIPRPRAAIPGSGKFGTTSGFSRAESVDEIFLSRSLASAAGFVSSWRVRFRYRRSDSSTGCRVRAWNARVPTPPNSDRFGTAEPSPTETLYRDAILTSRARRHLVGRDASQVRLRVDLRCFSRGRLHVVSHRVIPPNLLGIHDFCDLGCMSRLPR